MNIILVIFIAFALALDAFSVSVAAGSYFGKTTRRQKFRLSFHFGLFQFMMPILGWFAGENVVGYISNFDHWIAFILLSIIGGKMIQSGLSKKEETVTTDITKGLHLVSLSVATSIDALAIGFSISIINGKIIIPAIIIGIVAAGMSLVGIYLGQKLSGKFGKRATLIGGIILVLIGLEILLSHLGVINF